MGLDNGIVIRDKNTNKEIEVCYWRKYWGLRNSIIHKLHLDESGYVDTYTLDVDDIVIIKRIIRDFIQLGGTCRCDEDGYVIYRHNYGTENWDWAEHEVGARYANDIERLTKLEMVMRKGLKPEFEVIFYDRY